VNVRLSYKEHHEGTLFWLEKPLLEHRITLDLEVRFDDLGRGLWNREGRIVGHISIDACARRAPIEGSLGLKISSRRIPYEFRFRDDAGSAFRFLGEKDLRLASVRESVEQLSASLFDASGVERARLALRFAWATQAWPSLRSVRLGLGRYAKGKSDGGPEHSR
jgi:hypothetical protein